MNSRDSRRDSARETILRSVRKRLAEGRAAGRFPFLGEGAAPPPPEIQESLVRQVARDLDPATLWSRFSAALEALGDRARQVAARRDVAAALERIVAENNLRTGIVDADAMEWLGVSEGKCAGAELKKAGDRKAAFEVDFGITLCDCAVAETGTIVLGSGPERSGLTSLAPPVHLALIPFSRLVPDLFDVAERIDVSSAPGAGTVWITGSSRTADIESVLIRGVHGPGHVIALGIADV